MTHSSHSFFHLRSLRSAWACLALGLVAASSPFAQEAGSSSAPTYASGTPSRAMGGFVGLGYGPQIRGNCMNANVCERGSDAVKLFGGYRFTPNLATEVTYYYLGSQKFTWSGDNGQAPTIKSVNANNVQVATRVSQQENNTQTLALGVALETEMLAHFTQQLRIGLGVSHDRQKFELADGRRESDSKNSVFPYIGAGLSYQVLTHMRLFTGAEMLFTENRNRLVLSVGAAGEF